MIFVTLGTHELPFTRILEYIDKADIDDEIIIQSGNTRFYSKKYKVIPFMTSQEFDSFVDKSDLVISHAGVGTIFSALRKNKKVITVPRLSKYREHNDDHQLEIAEKFSKEKYIINCLNYEEFIISIRNYKNFDFKKYKFKNERIINYIQDYIDNI